MQTAVRLTLLAAAALGAVCVASAASAQAYGYAPSSAAPPPPPPLPVPGQVFERDDRWVSGPDTPNSDGTYGYQNYSSRPDATPDDPNGYAYRADKDRRFGGYGYGYRRDDDGYGPPPYARGYGRPSYGDDRRDDDGYGAYAPPPPPRYAPGYGGGYPAYGPSRGW